MNSNKSNTLLFSLAALILMVCISSSFAFSSNSDATLSVQNVAPNITLYQPGSLSLTKGTIKFNVTYIDDNLETVSWVFRENGGIVASGTDTTGNSTVSYLFVHASSTYDVNFTVTDGLGAKDSVQWHVVVNASGGGGGPGGGGGGGPIDINPYALNYTNLNYSFLYGNAPHEIQEAPENPVWASLMRLGGFFSPSMPVIGLMFFLFLLWLVLLRKGKQDEYSLLESIYKKEAKKKEYNRKKNKGSAAIE